MQNGIIIGCGKMGQCHGDAYRTIDNVSITAVVDTDREKGEALACRLGCRWVGTLSQLQVETVDFADICLPTFLHLSAIREASAYTSNIICEKPLTLCAGEMDEVKTLAEKKQLRLMTAHVLRFWDTYAAMRDMICENALGTISSLSLTRRQERPRWSGNHWLADASKSGGLIFDLMIHDIDYVVWLFGMPAAVYANVVSDGDGLPAHAKVQMQYENCTADLFASWGMPRNYPLTSTAEIIGSAGMLSCGQDGNFLLTDESGTRQIPVVHTDPYREELAYFIRCCEENLPAEKCDIRAVTDTMTAVHAAVRSAEENRVIRLV